MTNLNWIPVAALEDLPLREGRCARIGSSEIAVFRLPDRVLAVDNRCPHEAGPLCDGITSGAVVACPLHGWRVSLETGAVARPSSDASVKTYPVRVQAGVVEVLWGVE